MSYRTILFAVSILAIAAVGLTAGLKPPIFLWWVLIEFVILVASFIVFARIEWKHEREVKQEADRTFRRLLHYVQCIRAGRDRLN